uniref:Integrase catalytic domain-containing protein n=1 Tax=Fagus sylvatica TaxID=28930 RepID=A0A2N9FKV6_FAGSY
MVPEKTVHGSISQSPEKWKRAGPPHHPVVHGGLPSSPQQTQSRKRSAAALAAASDEEDDEEDEARAEKTKKSPMAAQITSAGIEMIIKAKKDLRNLPIATTTQGQRPPQPSTPVPGGSESTRGKCTISHQVVYHTWCRVLGSTSPHTNSARPWIDTWPIRCRNFVHPHFGDSTGELSCNLPSFHHSEADPQYLGATTMPPKRSTRQNSVANSHAEVESQGHSHAMGETHAHGGGQTLGEENPLGGGQAHGGGQVLGGGEILCWWTTANDIDTYSSKKSERPPKEPRHFVRRPPYPIELLKEPYPEKYDTPVFALFDGRKGSAMEHISKFLDSMGPFAAHGDLCLREFSKSLVDRAYTWYTVLPAGSIRTWEDMVESFCSKYFHVEEKITLVNLHSTKQQTGEDLVKYIHRFRDVSLDCHVKYQEGELVEVCIDNMLPEFRAHLENLDITRFAPLLQKARKTAISVKPQVEKARDKKSLPQTLTVSTATAPSDQVIKLPKISKQPTAEEQKDPKYCRYHRYVNHPTVDCRTLRWEVNRKIQNGTLQLSEEQQKVHQTPFPNYNKGKGKAVVSVVIHGNVSDIEAEESAAASASLVPAAVRTLQKSPKFKSLFNQLGFGPEARNAATEALITIAAESGATCFTAEAHASRAFLETTNAITFTDEDMEVQYPDHRRPLYLSAVVKDVQVRRALVDTGSCLNLIPLSTLQAANVSQQKIQGSPMEVTGFGRVTEYTMGHVQLVLKVGPIVALTRFHVVNAETPYHGRLNGKPIRIAANSCPFDQTEAHFVEAALYDDLASTGEPSIVRPCGTPLPAWEDIKDDPEIDLRELLQRKKKRKEREAMSSEEVTVDHAQSTVMNPQKVAVDQTESMAINSERLVVDQTESTTINSERPAVDQTESTAMNSKEAAEDQTETTVMGSGRSMVDHARSTVTNSGKEATVDQTESTTMKKEKSTTAEPNLTSKEELEVINLSNDPNVSKPISISKSLSAKERKCLIDLLHEYKDVFAWDYHEMPGIDPGLVAHSLNVEPGTRPVVQPMRTFHTEVEAQITQEVKKLLAAGFIKPIQHPRWLSNIVPVKKKNGQIRYLAAGHAMFSFMDGFSGYNQIRMSTRDAEKTAFRTPIGNFYYTVMPFGLKNAGATYQRTMTAMFHDMMHKEIEDYVDDIVVKSKKREDHLRILRKVFDRCRLYKLKMNPLKSKASAIATMKAPTSHKELKSFLGRLSYIRRFIPGLAAVTAVFTPLMKKRVPFVWSTACQQAFEKIQLIMTKLPTVCAPVPWQTTALAQWLLQLSQYEIITETPTAIKSQAIADLLAQFPGEDSSSISHEVPGEIGEALLAGSEDGETIAKSFKLDFSCSNNASEYEAYITGLAIAHEMGIKHLRVIGDSNLIICQTKGEFSLKEPSLALYRALAQKLEEKFYTFEISHAMRCENRYADALATLGSQVSFEGSKEQNLDAEDWRTPIKAKLMSPEGVADLKVLKDYVLIVGDLYRRLPGGVLARCVNLQEAAKKLIEVHEKCCELRDGTSQAAIRIKKLATRYFVEGGILFRKGFHGDLLRCLSLAESQTNMATPWPFHTWGLDLIGPINPSSGGYIWILVATEYFSKWVEAIPLRKATGAAVANFIREHIITRFGIPHKIISDNGTPFVNKNVREVLEHYRIKHRRSTPYYPQGNGQAEATNRMLLRILSKMVFDYGKGWSSHLEDTLWAYRGSTKTATGFTPFSLVYGTDAISPTELLVPSPRILHGMDLEADADICAEARVADLERIGRSKRAGPRSNGVENGGSREKRSPLAV